MNVYESETIVVRVSTAAKLELAGLARENDRFLWAEVRRGLRRYLEDLERSDNEEDV